MPDVNNRDKWDKLNRKKKLIKPVPKEVKASPIQDSCYDTEDVQIAKDIKRCFLKILGKADYHYSRCVFKFGDTFSEFKIRNKFSGVIISKEHFQTIQNAAKHDYEQMKRLIEKAKIDYEYEIRKKALVRKGLIKFPKQPHLLCHIAYSDLPDFELRASMDKPEWYQHIVNSVIK